MGRWVSQREKERKLLGWVLTSDVLLWAAAFPTEEVWETASNTTQPCLAQRPRALGREAISPHQALLGWQSLPSLVGLRGREAERPCLPKQTFRGAVLKDGLRRGGKNGHSRRATAIRLSQPRLLFHRTDMTTTWSVSADGTNYWLQWDRDSSAKALIK